jgi:hypothetical protein
MIGSEVHWVGGRPSDVPLLWKIHGSIAAPGTIVLSPTEYQRIYETNALGAQLAALGISASEIWSLGAGLQVDDIWAYLCGRGAPSSVLVAVLLRSRGRTPVASTIAEWADLVAGAPTTCVLHADDVDEVTLAERLTAITKALASQRLTAGRAHGPRARLLDRSKAFEQGYRDALRRGNEAAALVIVEEFRHDFHSLREFFMSSRRGRRIGERWCPSIPSPTHGSARLGANAMRGLQHVVTETVARIGDLCRDSRLLLPLCAAQATIGYMIELCELMGLRPTMASSCWPLKLTVATQQQFLTGMNPFFVNAENRTRCHLMEQFETERAFALGSPILDAKPSGEPLGLLTENEWEAAMLSLYGNAEPDLRIEGPEGTSGVPDVTVPFRDLALVPPLYPWGFRLHDVIAFRATFPGRVSQIWSLVADVQPGGNQICKGGGWRDRGRRSFRIGSRGTVRIGEHDEFVEPARFFEA